MWQLADTPISAPQSVELQLPRLLGDVVLTSACIIYLGGLLPSQRQEALEDWMQMLAQAGIAASPDYNFRRFLELRQQQLLGSMPSDVLAGARPAWRDNLMLMCLSGRPLLIFDPTREGTTLLKSLHGKNARTFYTIHDDGLPEKVCVCIRM